LGRNINTIKNKGGTEEHHQKLNKDSQSFGWDVNWVKVRQNLLHDISHGFHEFSCKNCSKLYLLDTVAEDHPVAKLMEHTQH
jgi:hypothetical protein